MEKVNYRKENAECRFRKLIKDLDGSNRFSLSYEINLEGDPVYSKLKEASNQIKLDWNSLKEDKNAKIFLGRTRGRIEARVMTKEEYSLLRGIGIDNLLLVARSFNPYLKL